jgi:hypothetical protein
MTCSSGVVSGSVPSQPIRHIFRLLCLGNKWCGQNGGDRATEERSPAHHLNSQRTRWDAGKLTLWRDLGQALHARSVAST